jgi:hypothetical protein
MDSKEKILEQLRAGLKDFEFSHSDDLAPDHDAASNNWCLDELQLANLQTLDFSSIPSLTTMSLSGLSQANVYTINGGGGGYSWGSSNTPLAAPALSAGKISLKGDDADIEINGESMLGVLRDIRDRLNIMQVDQAMEAEWEELRELREAYDAKLQECRAKSKTWKSLKS